MAATVVLVCRRPSSLVLSAAHTDSSRETQVGKGVRITPSSLVITPKCKLLTGVKKRCSSVTPAGTS
jgi:hypothetical protein